jgi:prevent-host-death family protein
MGIRELRDNLTEAIRRVRSGETIEVTHDGVPVAVISPISRSRIDQLVAAGEVRPARPLSRPLHRFPITGELSASEALEEDRAEA